MTGNKTQAQTRTPARDAITTTADRPRGSRHDYTDAERVSAALLAVIIGVKATSERLDVPENTLYSWLKAFGGPVALRDATRDVLAAHQYGVALLACEHLARRLQSGEELPFDQVVQAVQLLGVGGARPLREGEKGADTPAPVQVMFNIGSEARPELVTVAPTDPAKPDAPSAD